MGVKRVPDSFQTMLKRVCRVEPSLQRLFELNSIDPQGTKILEDREIRHGFCWTSEDTPPQEASPRIVKYTGSLVSPEWEDVEKGTAFPSRDFEISAQGRKEKFETLCHVKADISAAPYTSRSIGNKTGYRRNCDVILLVGLTELKAQVSWIDPETVSVHMPPEPCVPISNLTQLSRV